MSAWEIAVSVAVLIVTYTSSVIGLALWLANKFRQLEGTIYKEVGHVRKSVMGMGLRLQRLELRVFGFTKAPADESPYTLTDPSDDQDPPA